MVTYEITASVREDLRERYERYMVERHIPDVLAARTFGSASFSRSAPGRYRIRYEALRGEDLERYIASHAPGLRKHFHEQFPDGIELNRENWDVVATWPAASAA